VPPSPAPTIEKRRSYFVIFSFLLQTDEGKKQKREVRSIEYDGVGPTFTAFFVVRANILCTLIPFPTGGFVLFGSCRFEVVGVTIHVFHPFNYQLPTESEEPLLELASFVDNVVGVGHLGRREREEGVGVRIA
jgi:hypothetical protein